MKQIAWAIVVGGLLLAGSAFPAEAAGGRGGGFHGGGGGSHRGGAGWHGGGSGWHGGGGGWHGGTRVFIGGGFGWWGWPGWWGPGWWGPSYPYYPYYSAPPMVYQQAPTQYIQQDPSPPSAPQYWYYCQNPQGYYPYVKDCPVGWMQVVPQPPPPGQ